MKKIIQGLILFLLIIICLNTASYAGDWTTNADSYTPAKEALYAATVNDSGYLLGQYCFKSHKSCAYLLGMRVACKSGKSYPVLVNSDIGSHVLQIHCFDEIDSGLYRYAFTNFDEINNIIKDASKIGFAIPMQGDQFKVIRFSLIGANQAVAKMKSKANKVFFKTGGSRSEEDL